MNKKLLIFIIAVVIVAALLACIGYAITPKTLMQENTETSVVSVTSTTTQTFSGIVEEVVMDCAFDAICSMKVDGRWVVFNEGWYRGQRGQLIGINDPMDSIGKRVEVYAQITEQGATLLGDDRYYIKVIN
jgi:hypothetical protein